MEVIAHTGCDTLYAEVTELDANGTNVGYSNDLTSGVSAMGHAKMIFNLVDPGVKQVRMSKIECY